MRNVKLRIVCRDQQGEIFFVDFSFHDLILGNFNFCLKIGTQEVLDIIECTGLRDKDGKEIWEGDILRGEDDSKVKIIWDNGGFCIESGEETWWLYGFNKYWEVVGNIYENPGLLIGRVA